MGTRLRHKAASATVRPSGKPPYWKSANTERFLGRLFDWRPKQLQEPAVKINECDVISTLGNFAPTLWFPF
jgi:hypothetical protein